MLKSSTARQRSIGCLAGANGKIPPKKDKDSVAATNRDLVFAIDGAPFFRRPPIEIRELFLGLCGAFLDFIEEATRQIPAEQRGLGADEPIIDVEGIPLNLYHEEARQHLLHLAGIDIAPTGEAFAILLRSPIGVEIMNDPGPHLDQGNIQLAQHHQTRSPSTNNPRVSQPFCARSWLGDREQCTDNHPRATQRGASNLYFPVIESALSIPPWSDSLQETLGIFWSEIVNTLPHVAGCDRDDAPSLF